MIGGPTSHHIEQKVGEKRQRENRRALPKGNRGIGVDPLVEGSRRDP